MSQIPDTGAILFVMLELTLTSPVFIGIVLLALLLGFGWVWFNYRIQQKKLELQSAQLKAERFANKRSRIIREISARLPQHSQAQIPAPTWEEHTINQLKLIAPSKLPIETEPLPKAEALEVIKPLEAIKNLPENSNSALITPQDHQPFPPQMPLEGKAAPYKPIEIPQSPPSPSDLMPRDVMPSDPTPRDMTPRPLAAPGLQMSQPPQQIAQKPISGAAMKPTSQLLPSQLLPSQLQPTQIPPTQFPQRLTPLPAPRPLATRNGPVLTFQKTSANEIQRQRGTKTDFHLNLDDSLYEQIKDYARWVASQSDFFTLEVQHTNEEEEYIPLLFDVHELEKRNGHWFELFTPINLDELSSQIKSNEGDVFCPFSQLAIEQLCAPARKIFNRVKEDGSPRYVQVIKESALGEFIDFLDDFKNILATQPAE